MDRRSFLSSAFAFGGGSLLGADALRVETAPAGSTLAPEIWRWTASQTRGAVLAGQVSCREVVEAHLARCADVNAIVDQAADAATLLDQMLARGFEPGRLFGIPITIKDNTDLKSHRTVNGLVSASPDVAAEDGPVARSLRAEGAIILGKTNTPCLSSR